MIDVFKQIGAVQREVGPGTLAAGDARAIRLRRTYDAPIEDVWDALTDPERIGRWFLPISGDYRVGGRYRFEGNAGGEIVACDRPHRLRVTWVYGEPVSPADISEVELRLTSSDADSTTLELEHTAIVPEEFWTVYGPGAVGVGWEGGLLGLALHLSGDSGGSVGDPIAWQSSEEGRDFNTRASQAWGVAAAAAGEGPEAVAAMIANTTQFYAPDPEASS